MDFAAIFGLCCNVKLEKRKRGKRHCFEGRKKAKQAATKIKLKMKPTTLSFAFLLHVDGSSFVFLLHAHFESVNHTRPMFNFKVL